MKNIFRLSIAKKIFISITLLIVVQGVIFYGVFSKQYNNHIKSDRMAEIKSDLVRLQETIQYLVTKQDLSQVQETISAQAVHSNLNEAYFFDKHAKILAATRIKNIGKNFFELIPGFLVDSVSANSVKSAMSRKNMIWHSENRDYIYALSPVVIGGDVDKSLRTNNIGFIYLKYDQSGFEADAQQLFIKTLLPVLATLLMAGFVLAFYFHISISQRLSKISRVAKKFMNKDYAEKLELSGHDEITDMSQAFNLLVQDMKSEHQLVVDREKNLSLTLNSIGDAVITTDKNAIIIRINPVAEKLTGWSQSEAQGKSVHSVYNVIDTVSHQRVNDPFEKVLISGDTVRAKGITLISKDNTKYQISYSISPIRDEAGNIAGLVLVFTDYTEAIQLRESAAQSRRDLQIILDNSPTVIYAKSRDGSYIFINRQYEILFGVKREDIIGKTDYDIFPATHAQQLQANDKKVFDAGHAIESEEIMPHEDGLNTYISVKFPMQNESGVIYAVCGISTDITERRKQEDILRHSQKMDALGKITGGVAHDFNNMLAIILGYAELLENNLEAGSRQAGYAKEITHVGERGARLTSKLLTFSRYDIKDAAAIDINEVLLQEKDILEKALTSGNKLVLQLTENVWPIFLDGADLQDAILNMTINAMHAMESGGTLIISTENEILNLSRASGLNLKEGKYVSLKIIDDGCGMDKATIENIFDPFFTTKGDKGTGLGLSQVYGFVESNHGKISIDSTPGKGTAITVYFPRYSAGESENIEIDQNKEQGLAGTETILVVDDEALLLEITSQVLMSKGYKVLTAKSGKKALKLLAKNHVDLVVSDIVMPEMDGYQLAKKIQKKYPQVKIQFVSGFTDQPEESISDKQLYEHMIYKPYKADEFLTRVRELLDGH